MKQAESYQAFYEQLGELYPETELVHTERQVGSRYWTVLSEILPFASARNTLVDVGCNDGVYTMPYGFAGGTALGVDISKSLVARCNEKARALGVPCSFIEGDIDSPRFRECVSETFDVALFSEVLEHVRNPATALSTLRSLLRKGGHMVLTTPTPLFNGMDSKMRYPIALFAGRKLLESHVVDTTDIPVLSSHGITASRYRHDGYYPKALPHYVEGFGFALVKSYTIGFPKKVRQAMCLMHLVRGDIDMVLRAVPGLNLLGITNVTVFRAV